MSGLASLAANLSGKTDQSKISRSDQSRSSIGKGDQSDKSANVQKTKPEATRPVGRSETDKTPSKSSDTSKPGGSKLTSSGSIKQSQGGASSVVNAEKRLQMMKKKAANKIQEKRASLK